MKLKWSVGSMSPVAYGWKELPYLTKHISMFTKYKGQKYVLTATWLTGPVLFGPSPGTDTVSWRMFRAEDGEVITETMARPAAKSRKWQVILEGLQEEAENHLISPMERLADSLIKGDCCLSENV